MSKRKYLIVVLPIVAILLGSLFYTSITQAQTVYEDAVEIDVLEWVTRLWSSGTEYREWGIIVTGGYPANLTFVFSPKQSSFNITNLVIVIYASSQSDDFTITINGVGTYLGNLRLPDQQPTTIPVQLDSNLIPIIEGINFLDMSSSGALYLSVYKVTLFVEYEYQTGGAVGGFYIPTDKLGILFPYFLAVTTLIIAISVTVAYIKARKDRK